MSLTATLPKTLLQFADVAPAEVDMNEAVLVLIDYQNEYVDGALALPGAARALDAAQTALQTFRDAGAPVIHVVQHSAPGAALFDPSGPHVKIPDALCPTDAETIVVKSMPSAFTGTELRDVIEATGRSQLVIIGFMTHMCVDSTARAAAEMGLRAIVLADACASRDLPHPTRSDGFVPAAEVHLNALAALSDRFVTVIPELAH